MKNLDYLLQSLRLAYLQGNLTGIRLHLSNVLKKAAEPMVNAVFRTQAYLEAAKSSRALGELENAINFSEIGISSITPSANSLDFLAALKRIRVLVHLDLGEIDAAKLFLEGIDGIEMNLQEGLTHITRMDTDVSVETWLLSVEVALAEKKPELANKYFNNAVDKLGLQESAVKKKRLSPMEMRQHEQYLEEIRLMCDVYGAILRIVFEDQSGYEVLRSLQERVIEKNEIALRVRGDLPNHPLLSKLKCLLGEWLPEHSNAPVGINRFEAVRWVNFGLMKVSNLQNAYVVQNEIVEQVSEPLTVNLPQSSMAMEISGSNEFNYRTTTALEQIATAFQRLEKVAPYLENLAFDKVISGNGAKSSALFGGHLMYFDLDSLLYNAKEGSLTGYIKFWWKPDYYESSVVLDKLPEEVRAGEGFLFFVNGTVIDATIGTSKQSPSYETAYRNFLTLVKMSFSIGLDVPQDLHGEAHQAANVAERQKHLAISQDDLINYLTRCENEVAGITDDKEPDDEDFDKFFAPTVPVLSTNEVPGGPQLLIDEIQPLNEVKKEEEKVNILEDLDYDFELLEGKSGANKTELPKVFGKSIKIPQEQINSANSDDNFLELD